MGNDSKDLQVPVRGVNLGVFKDDKTVSEQDKLKIREYAKLVKHQETLHKEIRKVSSLLSMIDSRWCRDYLWINQQGEVIPLFDIDDDYLKNIYNWSLRNKKKLNKAMLKEYISRFGLPEALPDEDSKFMSAEKSRRFYDEDEFDDF